MEGTIGEIRMFAGNFAPKNWYYCDGSLIAIRSNTALFSILGTNYGGDGQTTFGLPDLKGRSAIGAGQAPGLSMYSLGEKIGSQSCTLSSNNLPLHAHPASASISVPVFSESSSAGSPTGNHLASLANMYTTDPTDTTLAAFPATVSVSPAGNNQPIPLMKPFLGMNYIICLTGIFPSRG